MRKDTRKEFLRVKQAEFGPVEGSGCCHLSAEFLSARNVPCLCSVETSSFFARIRERISEIYTERGTCILWRGNQVSPLFCLLRTKQL